MSTSVLKFAILLLFLFPKAYAQDDLYQTGMKSFSEEDYLNAINSFTNALDNKFLMKGKFIPRAYNYRAHAIAEKYTLALKNNDTKFISEFPNILIIGYEDLENAIKYDDGKCYPLIAKTREKLHAVTLVYGQKIADSLRLDHTHSLSTDSLVALIKDEILALDKQSKTSYATKDILGLLAFKSKNYDKAAVYFEQSEALYPTEAHDLNHVYNYYYSGLINYHHARDFEAALNHVRKARKFMATQIAKRELLDDNTKLDITHLETKLEDLEFQIKLLLN